MGAWEQGTLHGCEIMRSHEGGQCKVAWRVQRFHKSIAFFHGLHNCVNFIHKLSPVVTGVAALEGGRRDAGVTLCGYSPRKFSPTNSVQQ